MALSKHAMIDRMRKRGLAFAALALSTGVLMLPVAAEARFHKCHAAYMIGNTRYEFSGQYQSPMSNMVYQSSNLLQGKPPVAVAWDKQAVSSADKTPFGSVLYYDNGGLGTSVQVDGGDVIFAQPVETPRLYLETGGRLVEGMMGRSWPEGPQNSIRLYASFGAGYEPGVRSPFAIVVADKSGRILYRARYAGITRKMEAEAKAVRQQIVKQFQLKPASGRGHPPECS